MSASIPHRTDFSAPGLRVLAGRCTDASQTQHLLSLAAVYDGMDRAQTATIGGIDRQTLRDWVHRFNSEGPDGPIDRKAPGRARYLSDTQMTELGEIVATGLDPAIDGAVRWRRVDLQKVIKDRFDVEYSERAISDFLKALGFSHISGRPQHPAQDTKVIEAFKKLQQNARCTHRRFTQRQPVEIWFQDEARLGQKEARLGQKNGRARLWAKTGTRPRLPADQRYKNAYLFRAICPARGKGAALMMPLANTDAMQLHLDEISPRVTRKALGVILMDRAGCIRPASLMFPGTCGPAR